MKLLRALIFLSSSGLLLFAVGWYQIQTHYMPSGSVAVEPISASDIPMLHGERMVALSGMPAAYRLEGELQILTVRDASGEVPVVYPVAGGPIALVRTGDQYMVMGLAVPQQARPVVIGHTSSPDTRTRVQRRSDTVLRIGSPRDGSFAVSVRSTPSLVLAAQFAHRFSRHGYPIFISPARVDGRDRYRVLVGPYDSRDAAVAVMDDVRWVVGDLFLVDF